MSTPPSYPSDGQVRTGGGAFFTETPTDPFASKLSREADIAIGIYLIIIGTGSFLGNGRVLWLSYLNRKKLRPVEMFVASLAVTDVGISVFGYPFAATSSLLGRWSFGSAGCTWYGFTVCFFGLVSIATMALVSFTRFLIVYMGLPGPYPTRPQTFVLVSVAWLYALFWACAPLAGWGRYSVTPSGLSCAVDWDGHSLHTGGKAFIICMLVFCAAVPAVIIVASYTGIFAIHARVKRGSVRHMRNGAGISGKKDKVQKAITRITLAVCGGFLLAWMPYAVVGLWAAVGGQGAVPIGLASAASLFAKSSSLWNPIIYCYMNKRFRLNACACSDEPARTQLPQQPQQPALSARLSPRAARVLDVSSADNHLPGATLRTPGRQGTDEMPLNIRVLSFRSSKRRPSSDPN